MNDDREVTCYALLTEHLAGKDVRDAARAAWFAQRDADDGCALMAATLVEAKQFTRRRRLAQGRAWRSTPTGRARRARPSALLGRASRRAAWTRRSTARRATSCAAAGAARPQPTPRWRRWR